MIVTLEDIIVTPVEEVPVVDLSPCGQAAEATAKLTAEAKQANASNSSDSPAP